MYKKLSFSRNLCYIYSMAPELRAMKSRIETMLPILNEKQRRLYLACEAKAHGDKGAILVSQISNVSLPTLRKGIRELEAASSLSLDDMRRKGNNGRKKIIKTIPDIEDRILTFMENGDARMTLLTYTTSSGAYIWREIDYQYDIQMSQNSFYAILKELGFRRIYDFAHQTPADHNTWRKQYKTIADITLSCQSEGIPVIVIDCNKEKALETVKASFVNQFISEAVMDFWEKNVEGRYLKAESILIITEEYIANKYLHEKDDLSSALGCTVQIETYPPGVSRWNKMKTSKGYYLHAPISEKTNPDITLKLIR